MARTSVNSTPDQFVTGWKNGMTGAITKIQSGIDRVTENPMEKAAASVDKQVQGVIRAAQEGKTQAALRAVDFNTWKTLTKQKVGERLQGGVNGATNKMTKFAQWLLPTVSAGMATINQMPTQTLQDSINKMVAWTTYMSQNRYKQ